MYTGVMNFRERLCAGECEVLRRWSCMYIFEEVYSCVQEESICALSSQ